MHKVLETQQGRRIAYHKTEGVGPCIVFLGGLKSDMEGTKAIHLEAWAQARGQAFLRFDYSGHGLSSGTFEEGCIGDWAEDVKQGERLRLRPTGWFAHWLTRRMVGSAARELEEEIGMRPGRLEPLINVHHSPGFCDEYGYLFLATDLTPVEFRREGPEEQAMEIHRVTLAEAVQWCLQGRITDAKSVAGLLAASIVRPDAARPGGARIG